ncbi:MAG: GNAT family N-acetyltransferase [Acidobacteriota bacterium]|nr:MAG: GNAT family N-acetyltransferase [Acidobacteriota bacterium]
MASTLVPGIGFRVMRPGDIPAGLRLCRAARWNQTERDWELFLGLSPEGCRVAVREDRVIGTVTTVRYEDRFAWIGMVLVDPSERGRGVGTLLMAEAMEILKDLPSIKLDATPAGHAVYRKLDFVDEYRLSRMERPADRLAPAGSPARPMEQRDLPAVAALDLEVFGADRGVILNWMREGSPEYAWVAEEQGRMTGFSFGRHGHNFEHLGPVVALDQQAARNLVSACLGQGAGKRIVLDAPRHDTEWIAWLESTGFAEQRSFIRMFHRGNSFPGRPKNLFAILGPEFG